MSFTGRMVGGDDNQNGAGGPAPTVGITKPPMGIPSGLKKAAGFGKGASEPKPETMQKKSSFGNLGAGKLSKSGATTRSESLARLRGKGALA